MASTARSLPRNAPSRLRPSRLASFLPDSAGEFLRRRLAEGIGLAQIAVALALAGALISFQQDDPSWNTALPARFAHVRNWLSLPGSYFSDLFIQTLGLASFLLPAVIAVWGWRRIRHQPKSALWVRVLLLLPGMLLGSAALAKFHAFHAWPMAGSMGGSVGHSLLGLVNRGASSLRVSCG